MKIVMGLDPLKDWDILFVEQSMLSVQIVGEKKTKQELTNWHVIMLLGYKL